ncbi:predicted protein [Naegleria gruberi]|uniref:Predicted protein n=2 Tax=Naegleria gruberi TaxID=5762 RepID=D2V3J0_NAEGR|nr:uncharacterized protein NAEGRDRAFT_46400 [Naegleria gruberi]EFC48646.1 predicted protein [Naegleria gruberi]|eukprot:XP_002681390.1 predicted protein [Naegleria gruberi strain NEG-M]
MEGNSNSGVLISRRKLKKSFINKLKTKIKFHSILKKMSHSYSEIEELGNLPSEQYQTESFRKLINQFLELLQKHPNLSPFQVPAYFDKQFFCCLWLELNKVLTPEHQYNVSRSRMKRKDMIEMSAKHREVVMEEMRKLVKKLECEEYVCSHTVKEVESSGIRGMVDFGVKFDGKIVKIGTAFVINPNFEEGKSLITVISMQKGCYPFLPPYEFKPHSIISYPWNLMRRSTESQKEIEEKMENFSSVIPDQSDVGYLDTFIKNNSKKRSIEDLDGSKLVEMNRKLLKLSKDLKTENEELKESKKALEKENLKQKNLLLALRAMMDASSL